MQAQGESKWRLHGVRVVHADELDVNTPQTPGMNRAAAITAARAGAEKLLWYVNSNKVAPQFANPPGYVPVAMNIQLARGAQNVVSAHGTKQGTVDGAIEAGLMFAGTPDVVFEQIKKQLFAISATDEIHLWTLQLDQCGI